MGNGIFEPEFLKRLERLSLNMEKLTGAGSGGLRKSKAKGSSVEFSDFREYSYGDDLRRVDWNAYGRFEKLFVKLFMEEREAMVNIFVDCSRSMDFGTPKKSVMGIQLAAAVAFLALNNMDRLCINLLKKDAMVSSNVLGGKGQFDICASFLDNVGFEGTTNMDKAIKLKKFGGRGLSLVISDFFIQGSLEDLMKYLMFYKQDIVFLHILSPQEMNPELHGQVRLKDSETGEMVDVDITPSINDKYQKTLKDFKASLKELTKKYGGTYVTISSADSLEKILFEDMIATQIIK
ncbi:DUF58 domain-containing protein [Lutispora thermophila]|uniref:DUF58 domain-containing protein n=1 Tax=Lutispora thermophila DSM 19022 TaxID=1122184 RepID=A0A1M6GDQ1_9FIRM|nr:DUF58 domain-containing protein [Lutispora thermophila]SHJ08083.1 Protein of unknown function DUF58 [Lutispora thermophila DSM 19022]